MIRGRFFVAVFMVLIASVQGCGDSGPKRVEGKNPFEAKARQTQKEKGQENIMKPGRTGPGTPPKQ
jgi:hypothetical protein